MARSFSKNPVCESDLADGKGYAAEMAKRILQESGVSNGIVNAAGDLVTWGSQPDGKPWTIGIASPDAAQLPFSYLNISDMAVATSGNYEKYALIDGIRYSIPSIRKPACLCMVSKA